MYMIVMLAKKAIMVALAHLIFRFQRAISSESEELTNSRAVHYASVL